MPLCARGEGQGSRKAGGTFAAATERSASLTRKPATSTSKPSNLRV